MKDARALQRQPGSGRAQNIGTALSRAVLLVLVLGVVAGLGVAVGGPEEPRLSPGQESQLAASQRAAGLASAAHSLAQTTDAGLSSQFTASARVLRQHAAALELPAAPSAEVPDPTTAAVTPNPDGELAPTPARFLSELEESARSNLHSAGVAEPGTARLLASTGSSQWLQVLALADLQDVPVPPSPGGPASGVLSATGAPTGEPFETTGTPEPATGCPRPQKTELPGLRAVRTAVEAERRSAYAYEVAAARSPDPAPLLELSSQHEQAAREGLAVLYAACSPAAPGIPAYYLESGFLDNPEKSLGGVEEALSRMYADLVGLTGDGARLWAIDQVRESAERQFRSQGLVESFPGLAESLIPQGAP